MNETASQEKQEKPWTPPRILVANVFEDGHTTGRTYDDIDHALRSLTGSGRFGNDYCARMEALKAYIDQQIALYVRRRLAADEECVEAQGQQKDAR